MMIARRNESRRLRLARCAFVGLIILAITLSAYGRMTGFDAIFHVVGQHRLLSDILFAVVATSAAVSAALMLGRNYMSPICPASACMLFMATASRILVGYDPDPAEWLRFIAAPGLTALLPVLGAVGLLLLRITSAQEPRGRINARRNLSIAITGVAAAIALYSAKNYVGIYGFLVQNILILVGAVIPFLSSLAGLLQLASRRSQDSFLTVPLAFIAIGSLIVLVAL